MKRDAINSTKLKKLCKRLDLRLYMGVGLMESLWHLTAREAPQGDIGKLTNEDIALALDYDGDADKLIAALIECRWLDETHGYRLVVHGWAEHCEDSIDVKLGRSVLLYADGSQPRMRRLSTKERAFLCEQYAALASLCAQERTEAHREPPRCALPLPLPLPKEQVQVRSANSAEPPPLPPRKAAGKKSAKTATTLPGWLPVEPWEAWIEMRKRIKKPLTDYAMKLAIGRLAKFHQNGYDIQTIINEAVVKNWQDFYLPKDADGNVLKPTPPQVEYVDASPEEWWGNNDAAG